MKRRALGKGLGSLLPERQVAPVADGLIQVDIDRVVPNPSQPRESFDSAELEDLAASIRAAGILQPILVRETPGGYELIAGERRLKAARMAGLTRIPAVVQRVEKQRSLELALIENIQRQQLNAIEEATAFTRLIDEFGLTQEDVADRVGRKRSSVANTLRLLKLPAEVQSMVREGALSAGHAKALLALGDDRTILETAEAFVRGAVSVRGAEEHARSRKKPAAGRPSSDQETQDPNIRDAEIRLQRALGTKVRIRVGAGGRGRIEVSFYGDEELERLFEILEGSSH